MKPGERIVNVLNVEAERLNKLGATHVSYESLHSAMFLEVGRILDEMTGHSPASNSDDHPLDKLGAIIDIFDGSTKSQRCVYLAALNERYRP